jgi:hypothetical protein
MRDARWTPWELGLAAGLKEIAKIAGSMRVLLQEWLVI